MDRPPPAKRRRLRLQDLLATVDEHATDLAHPNASIDQQLALSSIESGPLASSVVPFNASQMRHQCKYISISAVLATTPTESPLQLQVQVQVQVQSFTTSTKTSTGTSVRPDLNYLTRSLTAPHSCHERRSHLPTSTP